MELYSRQGRHAAALRQYRSCAELLAKELSIEPDATTKQLHRAILREWNRVETGTSSDVHLDPVETVSEIKVGSTVTSSLEQRQLTVLVCGLANIGTLAKQLDPEKLQELIAAYQHCCSQITSQSGGTVTMLPGGETLIYFGYPQAREYDAERAVRAGLSLVEAIAKLDGGRAGPMQLSVGITTGPVICDPIGNGANPHALVGEVIQLAISLLQLAKPNTVVISMATRRLIGGLFDYEDHGLVALKGFSEPIPVWRVLGTRAVDSRFEALRTSRKVLVGRVDELDLLMRRWQKAKRGEGAVVLLSGEPGIGKSCLTMVLQERIQAEPHIRLSYVCSPHDRDTALYPFVARLVRVAGFGRSDTLQQKLTKLEAVLSQATNDLKEVVPIVADLMSIPTGDRYSPLKLTPQKRKEKTLRVLLAEIEALSKRQPVFIVFEDAHWIDPTSLEALDLLIDRIPSLPVLLIVTFRQEFTPAWIGRPHVTSITLNRLPPRQCTKMIAIVTGGKSLPEEVVSQIVDRADGVPLFVEELTKTVLESGMVAEAVGHYTVTRPAIPSAIPTSLEASLLARLDRLATTREVVQIGAALGRQFSHELISTIATLPQSQLDDAMEQLVRAELVFRRGTPPDAEYTFKHALVQDAAYRTLLRRRRQQIHERIVVALENHFPEITAAQPQFAAHHCTEAGLNEKAVAYWLKAGQQAVARSAMKEAQAQLQKGLDLLANVPRTPGHARQELELVIALGRTLMATKGYSAPEVAETIFRARALTKQLDRSEYSVPLLYFQRYFHLIRAEHKLALSFAEQIAKVGEVKNAQATLLLGRYLHGISRFYFGEFIVARNLFERCDGLQEPANRATYTGLTLEDPHAASLAHLGLTLASLGYLDQARARLAEALSEAHRLDHPYTVIWVLSMLCGLEAIVGSPHETKRHADKIIILSTEHGFSLWLAWGLLQRGWSLTALGQAKEGLTLLKKALSMRRPSGAVLNMPRALCFLAEAFAKVGRLGDSLNCLAEAAQLIETTGERAREAEFWLLRGDLMIETGDRLAAEQNYCQAITVAKQQSAKPFELRAATALARLWRDQGKCAESRNLIAPVYNWFTEGLDTPVLKEARALLDELDRRSLSEPTSPPEVPEVG